MKLAGIILVIVGTLMLLVNTGIIPAVNWGIIWAAIFIALGVNMFLTHGCNKMCLSGRFGKRGCCSDKEMECEDGVCEEGECTDCKK